MDRLSPTRFKADLAALAASLRRRIEAEVAGFSADPKAQAERRRLARSDFQFFAQTYFPHYIQGAESRLHKWLFKHLPAATAKRGGARLAVAAPRGEAKSTIACRIFVLWCALTGRKQFIPIIMDAWEQAATMLDSIKAELEVNPRLQQDFPQEVGEGRVWREGVIVTRGDAKIQAFGSGKRMRGLSHGARRPDLVICDDLENDENVRSRNQREKLESWFKKAVLNLGPPDGSMDVILIGTVLHHDSLLSRILQNPLWQRERFQAILSWPDRMDLWERWEGILKSDGEAAADRYFARNKKTMVAGSVVSWPAMRPIERLMKIRADDSDAFDCELQNSPVRQSATFGQIHFWTQPLREWLFFGAVDPSMGKTGKGDPSAILVGGYDRATGILDVVEADIRRRPPDQIIADVIALQMQYECRLWVVETVQFQEFFKQELVKQSAALGVPVPARGVKPTTDKELRITSLQPHIANGLIRLHERHTTLIEQLRHHGQSDTHDDGPDALQMLWAAAVGGLGRIGAWQSTGRVRAGGEGSGAIGSRGFGSVGGRVDTRGY